LAFENGAVAVSDFELLALLNEHGPATHEELAGHRSRPLGTLRIENRLPLPQTIRRENTLQPPRMPGVGEAAQRIGEAATLLTALLLLQARRKVISVTIGRGKRRRTLWMTPQQGRELMDGIGRALD
jgi:hypothetical protein